MWPDSETNLEAQWNRWAAGMHSLLKLSTSTSPAKDAWGKT